MEPLTSNFSVIARKMREAGEPEAAIRCFEFQYQRLIEGETGELAEAVIRPTASLPDATTLEPELEELGCRRSDQVAVLKLNGGLGTTMGLDKAKSLLSVKENLSFLDLIARQTIRRRQVLLLMNSFATETDTLQRLAGYDLEQRGVPVSFLQHRVPKLRKTDLRPVEYPANPDLEWCPPGHGDLYTALGTRGLLARLLAAGLRYLFISNADNLPAVPDPRILGFLVANEIPFLMEVAERSEADRKGGHLALLGSQAGPYVLRESAQCPEADRPFFQDIERHRYFNTNNLWIDLFALRELGLMGEDFLPLPLIRNEKTVDPADPGSTAVYQLETAAGAAISVIPGARAITVPRSRFAPVKSCSDLLGIRSDAMAVDRDWTIVSGPGRGLEPLVVELDPRYYQFLADLETRFPAGPPSLIQCRRLRIQGEFIFGRGVVCRGEVSLFNRKSQAIRIPDGTVLEGEREY